MALSRPFAFPLYLSYSREMKKLALFLALALFSCSSGKLTPHPTALAPMAPHPPTRSFHPLSKKTKLPAFRDGKSYRFTLGKNSVHIYDAKFGRPKKGSVENLYAYGPVLEIQTPRNFWQFDLREEFATEFVSHVFSDSETGRIWVLLEAGIEGPADSFTLLVSENGGESWFKGGDLPKAPGEFPPGELQTLWVDSQGHGEALFYREPNLPEAGGVFRSITSDGGRTWMMEKEAFRKTSLEPVEKEQ